MGGINVFVVLENSLRIAVKINNYREAEMKIKLELTVGDCAKCPWLYIDFGTINHYHCSHFNRVFGEKITINSKIKPIKEVEKFCPLREIK